MFFFFFFFFCWCFVLFCFVFLGGGFKTELYLHESRAFLIKILVVFLLRTDPASRKAKPACMTGKNI